MGGAPKRVVEELGEEAASGLAPPARALEAAGATAANRAAAFAKPGRSDAANQRAVEQDRQGMHACGAAEAPVACVWTEFGGLSDRRASARGASGGALSGNFGRQL